MSEDKIIFKAPHSGIYRVDNGKVNLEVRVAADCQECFNLAHDLLKQREENEKLKAQIDKCEAVLSFYADKENWTRSHLAGSGLGRTIIKDDGEKHVNEMDQYYLGDNGGKKAREYFKEKEQVK